MTREGDHGAVSRVTGPVVAALGPLAALVAHVCAPLRAVAPLRTDLRADPRLRYLLALAFVLAGFGIWFRVPNFAGPDEFSRLLHPMKPVGYVAGDPGFAAFRRGLLDGRALGGTFYLYALVLAPVFVLVLATGQLGAFTGLGGIESRWTLWHATPAWFWTASVLLGRLVSVVLAVACVYMTYRLGVRLRDRLAGQVAALSLALSVGFLGQAHVLGEDVPMLAALLATLLLAARYAETGSTHAFLLGAFTGGLAIALKLSGGVGAVALGVAHLDRARRSDDPVETVLAPRVVLGGLAVGLATVVVGIPSVLVGGPDELVARATGSIGSKTGRAGGLDAPIAYWFLRQYVAGLGLPLFLAAVAGTVATLWHRVRDDEPVDTLVVVLVAAVGTFLLVYSRWEFVRVRHLLPTFPVVLAFLGVAVSRARSRHHGAGGTGSGAGGTGSGASGTGGRSGRGWPALRVALVLVLVATAAFAGAAEYQYVTEPRDRATSWIATNTAENASIEVYENSVADVAIPHDRETVHYDFPEERATNTSSLVLNESAFTAWMLDLPSRRSDYVQLTGEELAYLDPTNPANERFPARRRHLRRLLDGEYNYTVVATFGTRRRTDDLAEDFFLAATDPRPAGVEERVVLLQRES